MSEENKFRVVLKGYGSAGKGEYYIEQEFANLFKIPHEKAKAFFKDTPKTLKENLSAEEAEKYQIAIEKTGAACEVENMAHDFGGLSLE